MQILLIGKSSYVGQSITRVDNSNVEWTAISRNEISKSGHAKKLKEFDGIVVIATPAMANIDFEWFLDENLNEFLLECDLPTICISSIRADDDLNLENRFYVNSLNKFESAAEKNNWTVLRISNFLGIQPVNFVNQQKLLPWSILSNIMQKDSLTLKSSPDQMVEWVSADDVVEAIYAIFDSCSSGKFVTRPSFEMSLESIVELLTSKYRSATRPILVSYGSTIRPKKLSIYDNRLTEIGWKSSLKVEVLLDKIAPYNVRNIFTKEKNG
jgi:hypothetical protein